LDIPVIFAVLKMPIFYLAKTELKKIPFFGWYIKAVGMIFIDRGNHQKAMKSLKQAGREIKKGKNIISFAEGTRPRDGEMKMFKRGSFVLALASQINVVPMAILGSKEVNPPGYKIKPGIITVKIGKMVNVNKFNKDEPDVLAKYVEDKVREMRLSN
jgi:1-acyl-sn-glycerol-3-phosphate acyltransferase